MAWLVLALFSFSLISPALLADAESNLPACCRRAGHHRCSMMSDQGAPAGPTATAARCPSFPGLRAAPAVGKITGAANESHATLASIASHPAPRTQTQGLLQIEHSRTGQKRGPPAFLN